MSTGILSPSIMGVASPMPAGALINIDPRVRMVQFSSMLNEDDMHTLAYFLENRSDITLRVFGNYDGTLTNLDFLRFFPKLRRFIVDIYQLDNIDGLVHLPPDLHELGIGQTKKRMSMDVLRRYATLKRLWLEGHVKGIGVLSERSSLVDLSLRSVTLPNLELLVPCARFGCWTSSSAGLRTFDCFHRSVNLSTSRSGWSGACQTSP